MNKPLAAKREIFLNKLTELVEKLKFHGKDQGEKIQSGAVDALTLEQRLCVQLMMKDYEGVKMALELGADPLYINEKGNSLYALARAYQDDKMVKLLETYGATPNPRKATKNTRN